MFYIVTCFASLHLNFSLIAEVSFAFFTQLINYTISKNMSNDFINKSDFKKNLLLKEYNLTRNHIMLNSFI